MVRFVAATVATAATLASAYERPELYSVDEHGVKHCTGLCRRGAPFNSMMFSVMSVRVRARFYYTAFNTFP